MVGTLAPVLRSVTRTAVTFIAAVAVVVMLSGCSTISGWFGHKGGEKTQSTSVFDLKVGDCFVAPTTVQAQLSDLSKVRCTQPHEEELYAVVKYPDAGAQAAYPGESTLDTFAQGQCAAQFTSYVGIAYPDSSLWMTYLLPSARSWQQGDDRSVLCFVTTTGQKLTASVKGSKQ